MRPLVTTVQANGSTQVNSPTLQLDHLLNPFSVGFGCVVSGTVTYTVQHTYDDPQTVASPTWFNDATVAAKTANAEGFIGFPIQAVRVITTSGTGYVTATFLQSGIHS